KVTFLSVVLFPVFLVLSLIFDEGALMIFPFIVLFAGLVLMLYARLFGEKNAPAANQQPQPSSLDSMTAGGYLPPASNIPFQNATAQKVRTKELAHPPSVTEHT